jgi:hypothetical protein
MSTSSSLLVPLQVTAALLAVLLVGLGIAWVRMDPPLAPRLASPAVASPERNNEASSAAAVPPDAVAAPAAAPGNDAPSVATGAGESGGHDAGSAVLYGTLQSAEGEAVKGHLWLAQGAVQCGTAGLQDGGKAFAFAGLPPGTYRLTARCFDQLPLARDVSVTAPQTRLDLTLDPRWLLTVHAVTPEGTPLLEAVSQDLPRLRMGQGVSLVALDEPLSGDLPPGSGGSFSGGLGVFRGADPFGGRVMAKTAVGVLALPHDRPVQVALLLSGALLAQQAVAPGTPEVTLTLPAEALVAKTATLRLRIVDELGAPVAGAEANLDSSYNPKSLTDAAGRIEFTKVMPGRRRCRIGGADAGGPPIEIEVPAGAQIELGDVVLRKFVSLDFAFDDFDGKGGVYLHLLDQVLPVGQRLEDRYVSAENGKQQQVLLIPGRYALVSRSEAGVGLQVIDTTAVVGQVLRPTLQRGASLRLLGDLKLPVELAIASRDGLPVWRRDLSGALGYSLPLPVGDYVATITQADGRVLSKAVHLTTQGADLTVP